MEGKLLQDADRREEEGEDFPQRLHGDAWLEESPTNEELGRSLEVTRERRRTWS